jgi:hypothetical protein
MSSFIAFLVKYEYACQIPLGITRTLGYPGSVIQPESTKTFCWFDVKFTVIPV